MSIKRGKIIKIKDIAAYTGLALLAGFIVIIFLSVSTILKIGAGIYDLFSREKKN